MKSRHHVNHRGGLLAVTCALLIAACSNYVPDTTGTDLGQGWTAAERDYFYYTTQGSRLIRRDWLLALERGESDELFLADGLARFGYVPGLKSSRNAAGLPIGFAVDATREGSWIGMTCAACHTSNIEYRGATLRIDGGPASADMFALLTGLDEALKKVLSVEPAFSRFAGRVLGPSGTADDRRDLREAVGEFYNDYFHKFVADSTPDVHWGPARLDAFGMIFNRVSSIDLGIPANSRRPNAPVSYPFLWGTSWHDWTQWNGAVVNAREIERLGRNVGQVLGVFGTVDFQVVPTYPSSVHLGNLRSLEQCVAKLTAPVWPEALFGKPDPDKLERGRRLYSRNCAGCHQVIDRDNQHAQVKVTRIRAAKVGTDPTMTDVAATRVSGTGILAGRHKNLFGSELLGTSALTTDLLNHAVIRVIAHGILADQRAEPERAAQPLLQPEAAAEKNYKARPLNGIWATGPYLHNGSVRTLWQLLQAPDKRERRFYVGSREFDPREVGFANQPGVISFELDTAPKGNWKSGHVFGTGLSDEQKWDLIEYMKTL